MYIYIGIYKIKQPKSNAVYWQKPIASVKKEPLILSDFNAFQTFRQSQDG